jgi:endonuclease/exonuclease/phosphatase family metal-dependent hydrolase
MACEIVIPDEILEKNKSIGPDALQRQFARTPYAVSFMVAKKTFVLLTLHVLFGKKSSDRIAEIQAIAEWIKKWAKNLSTWNHSLITLGDFNVVKEGDPTYDAFVSTGLHVPDDFQHIDRTIFKKTYSFYDQIAWFDNNISMEYKEGGIFDFRENVLTQRGYTTSQLSYRISDHFPLWTEFLT